MVKNGAQAIRASVLAYWRTQVIHILYSRATPQQVTEMLEIWELTIKLAVDVERRVMVGGGKAHADCEAILLANGSQQKNVWGASYLPELKEIRYDSVINFRPSDKHFSAELRNPLIRKQVEELIKSFLEDV